MPRPFLLLGFAAIGCSTLKTYLCSSEQSEYRLYAKVTHKSELRLPALWIILSMKYWAVICQRRSLFPEPFDLTRKWQDRRLAIFYSKIYTRQWMGSIPLEEILVCKQQYFSTETGGGFTLTALYLFFNAVLSALSTFWVIIYRRNLQSGSKPFKRSKNIWKVQAHFFFFNMPVQFLFVKFGNET